MAVTVNKTRLRNAKPQLHRQAPLAGAVSIWIALLANPAAAQDWLFTPTLGASAILTDNVNQSATNKQSSLILSATPGFSLQYQGSPRVQAAMNYGLTGVTRTGEGQSDSLFSSLNANGKAELVDNFLFLDASAVVSQQLISLLGSPANATINDSNNAAAFSYAISPYIKQRFGNFADAELRYSATGSAFNDNAANDIYSNTLSGRLDSGREFSYLFWGLDFSMRNANVQGGQNAQFNHYGSTLGYDLTRHLRTFGTLGYDSNDYTATPGTETSGRSWTLGMDWTPNRRTNVKGSFGESYFGRTYSFDFNYRSAHSAWTASYSDGVSDISQQLQNTTIYYRWNCDGGPGYGGVMTPPPNRTGCTLASVAPVGSVTTIGLANGIYVSQTFQGAVAWTKGRSSLGLNVFDTIRQYQQLVGIPEDTVLGVAANYAYRLQPHTTLNAGLAFTNTQSPAGLDSVIARDDNLYTANVGVSHEFGSRLSGTLGLRHQRRDSNDPNANFTENNLSASVYMTF
jgi:uncharacterized protein (PEP-CTERM system associated)